MQYLLLSIYAKVYILSVPQNAVPPTFRGRNRIALDLEHVHPVLARCGVDRLRGAVSVGKRAARSDYVTSAPPLGRPG